MYTSKIKPVLTVMYFKYGETFPVLRQFTELEGATQLQILQTIVARQIALIFGVGSIGLQDKLSQASYDIALSLGPNDGDFFRSLLGEMIDGNKMNRAENIIRSFHGRVQALDVLLEDSQVI